LLHKNGKNRVIHKRARKKIFVVVYSYCNVLITINYYDCSIITAFLSFFHFSFVNIPFVFLKLQYKLRYLLNLKELILSIYVFFAGRVAVFLNLLRLY
jgi:hypothetical protein